MPISSTPSLNMAINIAKMAELSMPSRAHLAAIDAVNNSNLFARFLNSSSVHDTVDEEILSLKKQLREMQTKAQNAELQAAEAAEQRKGLEELLKKESLQRLLTRTTPESHQKLLEDEIFRSSLEGGSTQAYVMSIDLRRSTDLMLKARSPELFAEFIHAIAMSLRKAVIEEYGVFDKFTGDGILAFFPENFSGKDSGYRAIQVASRCHFEFSKLYSEHRKCFDVILKDVGLGVGIDYGTVNVTSIGDLTVVGTPVVYACRLGAAPAGHTYLNQTAYEVVSQKYEQNLLFRETSLDFKHEGAMVAYDVQLSHINHEACKPDWVTQSAPTNPDLESSSSEK